MAVAIVGPMVPCKLCCCFRQSLSWFCLILPSNCCGVQSAVLFSACMLLFQLSPTLCDPKDCSLPGSSVHGIFQAIILEQFTISFSRGSSQLRARTCFFYVSCIDRKVLYHQCHLGYTWRSKDLPFNSSCVQTSPGQVQSYCHRQVWMGERPRNLAPNCNIPLKPMLGKRPGTATRKGQENTLPKGFQV